MSILNLHLCVVGLFFTSDCIYHFCEGHDATQHAAFGEAAHIAVTLRMHEESSYDGLDLIECEVRRRTFWLLFGGTTLQSVINNLLSLTLPNVPVSGQINVNPPRTSHLP